MFSIQKIISDAVLPKEEHKKERWWASDLGKCLRGAYYARKGVVLKDKPDDRRNRVFQVGRMFEDWVIETIQKQSNGIKITRPETIYLDALDVSVRPDLIIQSSEEELLYEIKTVHSDKFWWMEKKGEGPDEHYLMQTWLGLYATGIQEGRLIYLSKDDLCMAEYIIKLGNKEIREKVMGELDLLNRCWKTDALPPIPETIVEGKVNWKAKYCPYHELCAGKDWLKVAEEEIKEKKKNVKRSRYKIPTSV